jgi:signal transduction histidine kinase
MNEILKENKKLKEYIKKLENKLMLADKMITLGENMSGIIHEINTPIGAIKSSSSFAKEMFSQTTHMIFNLSNIDSSTKKIILSLIRDSEKNSKILSTKEERKIKKLLILQLDDLNISNAKDLAKVLLKLNITELNENTIKLLENKDKNNIFSTLEHILILKDNIENNVLASNNIINIVQALKAYTRYNNQSKLSNIQISIIIETVLIIFYSQIKAGIEINKEYETDCFINCYHDELMQVFTNLIGNAIQAMDGRGQLNIKLKEDEEYLIVSIKDNGKGIPKDIQDKIFDKFFTTKPIGLGSGLGLDIVKKIVEKHNGKIEFNSQQDIGTEFKVFISKNIKSVSID